MSFLTAEVATAQAPAAADASVTLEVTPQVIAANGQVKFLGLALAAPNLPVVLTVTLPSAAKVTVQAVADQSGHYSLTFSQTGAVGHYSVSAQTGSGAAAHGEFTVQTMQIALAGVEGDLEALETSLVKAVPEIKASIDNLPDSPARQDTETALDRLAGQVQKLPSQSAALTRALQPIQNMIAQRPGSAVVVQPLLDQLAQWDVTAKATKADVDKQVAASKQRLAVCDSIDSSIEALQAVSAGLNLAAKPFAIITNFAKDFATGKAAGGVNSHLQSDDAKWGVSEVTKLVPTMVSGVAGPIAMFAAVASFAVDCAQLMQLRNFNKYCEKFSGPFTATMEAHFYAKGFTKAWWSYTTTIAGKLVLRYPKAAGGQSVALTGQLEGAATNFTYQENVFFNSDLFKIAKGGVVRQVDVAPGATPAVDWEGSVVNAFSSPTSFYVAVSGQLLGDTVTLTLGDARSDFIDSYTQAHTMYTVAAPLTLMLPVPGHFSLPYQDAHFILNHLIKGDFPVQRKGASMVISKTDTQSRPMPGNDATYTLKLQTCNPACD